MTRVTVERSAPAKINLYLRVVGRQPDGYHEIDSLFLPLELADRVTLDLRPDRSRRVSCRCPGHSGLDGADNLAARAADLLLRQLDRDAEVEITLHKQIWVAAGLGGGSSDAAAVLCLLRGALGHADLDLAPLARQLGADVPYFLDPKVARARGIGDRLTAVEGIPALDLVLVNPGERVSTAQVYGGLGSIPSRGWQLPFPITADNLADLLHNDLEAPARRICPSIDAMREAVMQSGASAAGLSGSGPTLFGLYPDAVAARSAAKNIADTTRFSVQVTRTVAA